jgi:predicted nucleotidyltransferase
MVKVISILKPATNLKKLEQRLGVSVDAIAEFCQRRQISELALFGSVLREDFNLESDIDFLVTFLPDAKINLVEIDEIEKELKQLVGREIDLIFKNSIEISQNWIRKRNILGTAEVVYGAR